MQATTILPERRTPEYHEGHVASGESLDLCNLTGTEDVTGNVDVVEASLRLSPHKPDTSELIRIKREPQDGMRSLAEDNVSKHTGKRRRLIVEVVVPTWLEVKRKREAYERDLKKIKNMKNPKVKKLQNMDLLADTIRDRLKPIGLDLYDITLDRASQEVWVTREFMSATYGGSMQATCPSIGKKLLARHGLNDFCYLNLDYQPQAPQIPGAPGLFYSTESGGDWKGDQRVLTRVRPNEWQYMGMYAIKTCKSLTKEEWASQPPKVRSTWAKQICLQGWGGWVQARVRARIELEREPTEKEIQNVFDNGSFRATTPDEVAEAYNKGQECLGVWTMKCVGYDNDFQLQLCQKFPNWIPRPRNSRKGKKSDMKPNTGSSQHRNNKRAHPSPASPESEDESFENDESE